MRKLLFKVFSSVFLLFITLTGLADTAQITSTAVDNHTDLSIAFLAQVFGTVGDVLHGTSGQMLGQLFYKFNIGILVVAGLWLGYTVVTIVLKSATDGSFMGANKNVAVTFLKIALGVGLLVPNPTTGYSIFQNVVMQVVVEGVALADQTWNYGLDYLTNGGSLWHRPEEGMTDVFQALTSNPRGSDAENFIKISNQIFDSEVCMERSSQISPPPQTNASSTIYNNNPPPVQYSVVDKWNYFQFPGYGNTQGLTNSGEYGNCGMVTWTQLQASGCGNQPTDGSQNSCQMAKNAVRQMVDDLLPGAKRAACLTSSAPECADYQSLSDNNKAIGEAFFSAYVDYFNAVMPIAQHAQNQVATRAEAFIPQAEQEGWMMAGRYYWDLSRIQASYSAIANLTQFPPSVGYTVESAPNSAYKSNNSIKQAVDITRQWEPTYLVYTIQSLLNYGTASHAGDTGGNYNPQMGGGMNWVVAAILTQPVADISQLIAYFNTAGGSTSGFGMGPDPIMFLHNVGMKCISLAGDIWFYVAGIVFLLYLPMMFMHAYADPSTPANNVLNWIKPPLMMMATLLLGVGILLGYYVPLYPFMLFIFGVVGWIICVIEAMVAAPIVCLGLTHPEGHDFLGEAKQALILLLSVFIRPVLMLIGLIAGMILSYVALRILVYTYSGFLSDIFYIGYSGTYASGGASSGDIIGEAGVAMGNLMASSGGTSGLIMSLLAFPIFLVIFAAMVYVVTNNCYSMIYALPDYIMRWIGGPTHQSMAAQMAQQVQGATAQFGSGMAQIASNMQSSSAHGREVTAQMRVAARRARGGGGAAGT